MDGKQYALHHKKRSGKFVCRAGGCVPKSLHTMQFDFANALLIRLGQ